MSNIHVTSEIGKLKKVLLHRPGNELLNLTPDTLNELLFDDIPYLAEAQREHDMFAKALIENDIEVVYLDTGILNAKIVSILQVGSLKKFLEIWSIADASVLCEIPMATVCSLIFNKSPPSVCQW